MQGPQILGGRYELRGVLGRGGMAEVHEGWDTRLGRAVAIKLMHPSLAALPENRRRFEVEARAAAGLNHPNVVAVHDSGEHDGTPYIVMERLRGRTLADVIAQGPLPSQQVRAVLDDVLCALSAAHAAGILHRDIKPANVLLTDTGQAKVADFGIAKSPESGHTMTGLVIGTLGYLSPERIAGRPATVADDLYAVGVLGYEALTRALPLPQQGPIVLSADIDPALASVVQRAVAPDPRARFTDADQMRAALATGMPGRPPTLVLNNPLPEPATAVVPARAPRSRARVLLGVAAAVVAAAVLVVAFVVDTASRPATPPAPAGVTSSSSAAPQPAVSPPPVATTPADLPEPPPQSGEGNGKKGGNGKGPKPKQERG
jgi:eukaryotic-like serine/threonine-protein kinase